MVCDPTCLTLANAYLFSVSEKSGNSTEASTETFVFAVGLSTGLLSSALLLTLYPNPFAPFLWRFQQWRFQEN